MGKYKSVYVKLLSIHYGLDCPGFGTRWVRFRSPSPSRPDLGRTRWHVLGLLPGEGR